METRNDLKVRLYNFSKNQSCLADITITKSETTISGFQVMPGLGGGIQVHMPPWMHSKWSYSEIQWSDVRKYVTETYFARSKKPPQQSLNPPPPLRSG